MKAMKKYLAVMMSIFMIAGVMPAAVYASPEEGTVPGCSEVTCLLQCCTLGLPEKDNDRLHVGTAEREIRRQ